MVELILKLIITLIVVGFIYWAWLQIRPLLPLPPPFGQVLDVLVIILVVAIVVFYCLIPVLQAVGHLHL